MELLPINKIVMLKDEALPTAGYFAWLKRDIKRHGLGKPVSVAKRSDGIVMLIAGAALLLAVDRLHHEGHEVQYQGVVVPVGMIPVKTV